MLEFVLGEVMLAHTQVLSTAPSSKNFLDDGRRFRPHHGFTGPHSRGFPGGPYKFRRQVEGPSDGDHPGLMNPNPQYQTTGQMSDNSNEKAGGGEC